MNSVFIRRIAIAGWSMITLVFLAYFLLVMRVDFTQMLVPCEGAGCNSLALSTTEVTVLTSWGLSMQAYAYFMSAVAVFSVAVYGALGGLIFWRQGSSSVGWVVSLALIVISISTYGGSTNWVINYPNLVIPGIFLNILGTVIQLFFFYLIPNGRFSPRWAYIPLAITSFLVILLTLEINGFVTLSDLTQNLLGATTVAFVILGGIFQVYRYQRESTILERQLTKWILFGVLTYVLSVIVWVLIFGRALEIPAGSWRLLANIGGWFFINVFSLLGLPVALTMAISRYRLWDIDIVIRRTLQYSILTGLLGLVYLGGVTVLQGLFTALSGQESPAALVLSTLAIAALFNPLRKRVQEFIDRRFYRRKYDAEKALAEFATVARQETDLEQLTQRLTSTVQETLQPIGTSLWLRRNPEIK